MRDSLNPAPLMARHPRPSFPAPSEPSLRRLGVVSNSGHDRPLRAQLVVALVGLLVLVAVPLYLWRRPSSAADSNSAPLLSASAASSIAAPPLTTTVNPAEDRLGLGAVQRVRCGASARSSTQEASGCDALPFFEQALTKAIRDTLDCAPHDSEGSINFVLQIDFSQQKVHVYPGASGKWKRRAARKATQCVKSSLPAPPWASIKHQYRFYQLAVMANYRQDSGPKPLAPAPSGSGLFE